MKLGDFVFRDINFFIDMFVESSNTESLKTLINSLTIYKWGVCEPGHSGRVLISCSSSGEIQKSSTLDHLSEKWMLFFAFLPEDELQADAIKNFNFIASVWTEGSSFFKCGGFEVYPIKKDVLIELIKAADES